MAKLFPPHFRAIVEALKAIFTEDQYADRVVARVLRADKRRGSKDRAFIAENTYEVVRHYRKLCFLAGEEPHSDDDWWRLIGISLLLRGHQLPAWREFQKLDPTTIEKRLAIAQKRRAVWNSIPDWLDELGETELGDQWAKYLPALNVQAPVFLRVNLLKTTAKDLKEQLTKSGTSLKIIDQETLVVRERQNLFSSPAFKAGLFEVQDIHSQQVVKALELEPGHTFIDACAGAGGKTMHAASVMGNKGTILALDIHQWKLRDLRKRARRAGVQNVEVRAISSAKVTKRLKHRADRLLLDVPCSGLGVLRRNPDAKWKLSPEFIDRLRATQTEILTSYPKMLKPDGIMIYATCSILPSENRAQVDQFLASELGQQFELIEDKSYMPSARGGDGFYTANLRHKS
ncbi:MAG: RsmB/NOP family class I SAM-dependent RNA methyltransferase [Bacteroidota bacterium]